MYEHEDPHYLAVRQVCRKPQSTPPATRVVRSGAPVGPATRVVRSGAPAGPAARGHGSTPYQSAAGMRPRPGGRRGPLL